MLTLISEKILISVFPKALEKNRKIQMFETFVGNHNEYSLNCQISENIFSLKYKFRCI